MTKRELHRHAGRGGLVAAGLLALGALWAAPAGAETYPTGAVKAPRAVVYGADSFRDNGGYGMIGATVGLDGLEKSGFVLNAQAEYMNFDFERSNGTLINVDGYGGSAMAGYQFVWGQGDSWTFLAGATYRDLEVEQPNQNLDFDGGNTSLRLQTAMYLGKEAPVDFSGLAYYISNASEYYGRGRLGVKLTDYLAIGPEVRVQGNTEFDGYAGGGFVRVRLLDNLSVFANGGYEDVGDEKSGYIGFEAGLGF